MGNTEKSNVITVDFKANKKDKGIKPFEILLDHIIPDADSDQHIDEIFNAWAEDLTPQERHEQLEQDLEFLRQMNVT